VQRQIFALKLAVYNKNLNMVYVPNPIMVRRIRILESFLSTKTNPGWMILTVLPVLPPNLRPLL
jgi:DNA-directed RNA polymerase beta' subunit